MTPADEARAGATRSSTVTPRQPRLSHTLALKVVYAREEFPKPRNILGLVKAIPDAEMKKLILANTVVGEQQLRSLAKARAAGVKAFLVNQGKMDSARVFQKSGDMYRVPARGGEPVSRVEFEVGVE